MGDAQLILRAWRADQRKHEAVYDTERDKWRRLCWACLRGSRPADWHAPWFLHRAHIVNKPRLRDWRCVVLLCPVCHLVQEGEQGYERPKLTRANMIWLKRRWDFENFDPEILQACCVGKLPEPSPPAFWYIKRIESTSKKLLPARTVWA